MITLPEYLEQPFQYMADMERKPADKLLEQIVTECLEDHHDVQLAKQTLADIKCGKVKVLSLADAKKLYRDLVN